MSGSAKAKKRLRRLLKLIWPVAYRSRRQCLDNRHDASADVLDESIGDPVSDPRTIILLSVGKRASEALSLLSVQTRHKRSRGFVRSTENSSRIAHGPRHASNDCWRRDLATNWQQNWPRHPNATIMAMRQIRELLC